MLALLRIWPTRPDKGGAHGVEALNQAARRARQVQRQVATRGRVRPSGTSSALSTARELPHQQNPDFFADAFRSMPSPRSMRELKAGRIERTDAQVRRRSSDA